MPCGHFTLLQTTSNGRSGHRMLRNRLNVVLWFVMGLHDPSLPYAQSTSHHGQWRNEVGVIGPICPSFPPASKLDRSASQLLGFFQHVDRFLRRKIHNPYRGYASSSVEFRNLVKRRSIT
ncbi:hypothetical protein TNCV_2975661 [Trichonephila clavipes]|nr:hypothetical protein TNCV_2975661 [Trichonephila clavipes]